jgi:aspartyl-tRNA(Asn)/glutamyl-tRNA(Gln) amidotransferase subunit B
MLEDAKNKYESVIGLEIHAQLNTKSKLFSSDSTTFGANPNTQISEITLALPGTLPKTNKHAIELAVIMGLACNCEIEPNNYFARKNYFYPDLPKGYQVTQHTAPICKGGEVLIQVSNTERNVQLNRIHLEEDAGKSIHDIDNEFTCLDYNRAGTPLIEIVTEPDIYSAEEAYEVVNNIRKLVRWLQVCDGNMEEGSLRCDANISIRLKGEKNLGKKVEVKNLNSIRNVKKAIEYEIERMIILKEQGKEIVQQTRSFDASTDTTFAIRDKEEANDYRYFPEPDLAPFFLSTEYIQTIKNNIPLLPFQLKNIFQTKYSLNEYDAAQLSDDKETAEYFIETCTFSYSYKTVANFILGPIRQYLNEQSITLKEFGLSPEMLSNIIKLIDEGKVSFSVASSKLLNLVIHNSQKSVLEIATENNLLQVNSINELEQWIEKAIQQYPDKVLEYKKGKKGLIGLFVGEVKKLSKGTADPKKVTELLKEKLN